MTDEEAQQKGKEVIENLGMSVEEFLSFNSLPQERKDKMIQKASIELVSVCYFIGNAAYEDIRNESIRDAWGKRSVLRNFLYAYDAGFREIFNQVNHVNN